MGFMDKIKGAAESAPAATSKIGVGASGEQMAQANKAQRLANQGVDTPAHIDVMTGTGNTDATNSVEYEVSLTVRPAGGAEYQATTRQYVHPSAATSFVEGADVTVRVDPDDSSQVLLWGPAS
jgi:hypothetical protein